MVSKKQNIYHIGIDKFICSLRSLSVKKDDISDEPLRNYTEVGHTFSTSDTKHLLSMNIRKPKQ